MIVTISGGAQTVKVNQAQHPSRVLDIAEGESGEHGGSELLSVQVILESDFISHEPEVWNYELFANYENSISGENF